LTGSTRAMELTLTKDRFDTHRPPWHIDATGLDTARPALGL
jgi:hypothetical protein